MRKEKLVTITADGRDKGRSYLLREMSASQVERWAARAFLSLAKTGVEIPDDIANAGLAGVALVGMRLFGSMSFEDAQILLDEMFTCITFVPDTTRMNVTRALIEDDIEEIETRLELRREIFALHVDFSKAATRFSSIMGSAAPQASSSTKTIRARSAQSSRRA